MASWIDRSVSVTTLTAYNRNLTACEGEDDSSISTLSGYELAYHHHLQTALQMGQFYNSEHLAGHQPHSSVTAAAALLRGSSSSSVGVGAGAMNQSPAALMNAGLGGSGSMNNCLGGLTANSLWDSGLIPGIQRGPNIGAYQHLHQHQANEVQASAIPHSCEIWTGAPANTTPATNGRGQRTGQHKSSSKKPRRRVATLAQRRAANIRERRRMYNLNEAFDKLRRKVPTFAYEKRLSRIETLRLAITYISFMGDILSVPDDTRNGLVGKSHSATERKGASSISTNNHHGGGGSQYGLMSTRSSNNGAAVLLPGIDCHQNQNVPPAISPFAPLARMYSHHPSSASYLHPNIHH